MSFLIMIIVFSFHYRGKFQKFHEFEEFDEFKSEFEYIWQLGFECKHVGSVDFVGPATRCQCYQHQWLFFITVMYSTNCILQTVNMNIYCNIINVIRK